MNNIKRLLKFSLPNNQSIFLWGPRQIGKSTYLKEVFFQSKYLDLLDYDIFYELEKRPKTLRDIIATCSKEELNRPIIIDEVQKIPGLLDEIHWLIENQKLSFILCGSSARKLKRGHANLLGGRAWRLELFPFVSEELGDFNLLKVLKFGLIPPHYFQKNPKNSIKAYVINYLKEEIQMEAIVRNIPAFSRFLEAAAFSHSELINYTSIGREAGVSSKTVKEYFQILEDTLLGRHLFPYSDKKSRESLTKTPKFYYFDNGIANFLKKISFDELKGPSAGVALESFIFHELSAYNHYEDVDAEISFWRTKKNKEIDFIINNVKVAIEVKISSLIPKKELKAFNELLELYPKCECVIVCTTNVKKVVEVPNGNITIVGVKEFLKKLWKHTYF